MKYLEYEIASGRILSEITCDSEPSTSSGIGLFQIGENEEIDPSMYAVRNGSLVKVGETNQEKLERERIRREHGEQCRMRLRSMIQEAVIAILADDAEELKSLQREYRRMKEYL